MNNHDFLSFKNAVLALLEPNIGLFAQNIII